MTRLFLKIERNQPDNDKTVEVYIGVSEAVRMQDSFKKWCDKSDSKVLSGDEKQFNNILAFLHWYMYELVINKDEQ